MCNLIHIKYYDHDTFFILLGELRKLGYDFSYRLNGKERDLNYIQDYDTFVSDNVKAKYMDYESIVVNENHNLLLLSAVNQIHNRNGTHKGVFEFNAIFVREIRDILTNNIKHI